MNSWNDASIWKTRTKGSKIKPAWVFWGLNLNLQSLKFLRRAASGEHGEGGKSGSQHCTTANLPSRGWGGERWMNGGWEGGEGLVQWGRRCVNNCTEELTSLVGGGGAYLQSGITQDLTLFGHLDIMTLIYEQGIISRFRWIESDAKHVWFPWWPISSIHFNGQKVVENTVYFKKYKA